MYDVVAVLGSSTSDQSIAATRLLGAGQVPMVSVFATSDELSNSQRFPYFLRVVPPDRHQFRAIAELIRTFAWTYVSVVSEDSSYGFNAFRLLSGFLEANGACLAVAQMLPRRSDKEIKSVAKALVEHHARTPVVVLILTAARVQKLITWTQHFLPNETFVWIGTDAWSVYADGLVDNNLLLDSLLVDVPHANIHSFDDWFIQLRPVSVFAPSIYE
ncbi:hypothetical protein ACOMHN_036915 [Nucella lapillus]